MASSLRTRSPDRHPAPPPLHARAVGGSGGGGGEREITLADEEVEMEAAQCDPELAPLMIDSRSAAPSHDPPVDWTITALLFLFPALGGMLFG